MINSATDHGYNQRTEIDVHPGDTFRVKDHLGISEHRVLRRSNVFGNFDVEFVRWLSDTPQIFTAQPGKVEIVSREFILAAMLAD